MLAVAHSFCLCCVVPCVRRHYRDTSVRLTGGSMAGMSSAVGSVATSPVTQGEAPNSRGPFASSTPRMENITQLHAAAVNGEKQILSRLIAASGPGELDIGDQFGRSPLMYCVLADRLECAELLLKTGSQVNFRDKGGRTALHWAAHKGNYRLMKLLLSRGADCREKDNEGQTPLHLCTRHKLPKCMAMLLRQLLPGEIDHQDNNNRTALHWAASYGNLEHVKMLIKQVPVLTQNCQHVELTTLSSSLFTATMVHGEKIDSNIGIPDTEGKTPLHWAASSRDPEAVQCVKLILETTPSVINWQDYEGRTALHLAVADGNQSIVDLLTSVEKCNVSALDNVFRTPLHWAAVLGHSKIVRQLLQSNADCTSSDSNGATPLHYAAQDNFDETVNVFLSWKNTDEPDLEGRTAFMWAAGKGADNVLRVFFHHHVDVQQEDKTGGTALHAAALSGHAATVQLLLHHGARINATDQTKHTPLFRACEMGHTDVAQALIDNGARVDMLDEDGRSPLHWAALGGHAYICQILIKYGVDPNIRDHSGRSPLHCAAYGGYVNCMSALMEHQADPNTQDKEGMTCLHWACSKGHLDAVKLLVENDAFPNHMEFREDRYTPLDYALMGEHHDVAQYMIEQGALSITGIQDIAATKIQSAFRGYRVRKTFIERKKLLMKHEMLKKEAARKRAGEGRKSEDLQRKETEDTILDSPTTSSDKDRNALSVQRPPLHTQLNAHLQSPPKSQPQPSPKPQEKSPPKTQQHQPSKHSQQIMPMSHAQQPFPKIQQTELQHQQQGQESEQQKPQEVQVQQPEQKHSPELQQLSTPLSPQLEAQPQPTESKQAQQDLSQPSQQELDKKTHPLSEQTQTEPLQHPPQANPEQEQQKAIYLQNTTPVKPEKEVDTSEEMTTRKHALGASTKQNRDVKTQSSDMSAENSLVVLKCHTHSYTVSQREHESSYTPTDLSAGKKRTHKKKKEREPTSEEKVLQEKTVRENVKKGEKQRKADFKRKQEAAVIIQRAWRNRRQEKIFAESAQKAVRLRRLQASQAEWERQIAALTIQLAWRKFFRRKLLKSLKPNRRQLQMWDPDIIALKQQALIAQIYGEELMVPFWHPTLRPAVRPFWLHLIPSPAAVSFNFAVDQYHPYRSWQGMRPHSWTGPLEMSQMFDDHPQTTESFRPERSQNSKFSYNLRKV